MERVTGMCDGGLGGLSSLALTTCLSGSQVKSPALLGGRGRGGDTIVFVNS